MAAAAGSSASRLYETVANAVDAQAIGDLHEAETALFQAHRELAALKAASSRRQAAKRPRDEAPAPSGSPPSSAAASAAAGAGAASGSASGGLLDSMLSAVDANEVTSGGALAGASVKGALSLEQSGDPVLFETELVGEAGWDPAGGKDLVVTVPKGYSEATGNTLTVKCTFKPLPGVKRTYGAVLVLKEGQDPLESCLAHIALWQFTDKSLGQDQFYIVGYRAGEWVTKRINYKTSDPTPGPVTFDKQFWLRFLITHQHMLMYIDGRLIAAHPLSPSHRLKEGDTIRIKLPVAADYGERSSVSVSGMWWGSAPLDQTGTLAINRLVQAAAKQAARPQAANLSNPCKVHVGGVPSEAREDTLFAHFAALEPQTVSLAAGKSFAFVTFATPELAIRAIREAPTMPFLGHTLSLELSKAR